MSQLSSTPSADITGELIGRGRKEGVVQGRAGLYELPVDVKQEMLGVMRQNQLMPVSPFPEIVPVEGKMLVGAVLASTRLYAKYAALLFEPLSREDPRSIGGTRREGTSTTTTPSNGSLRPLAPGQADKREDLNVELEYGIVGVMIVPT
jgi:hypothetical protein